MHLGFLGYILTVLRPNSIVMKLVGVLPLGYFMLEQSSQTCPEQDQTKSAHKPRIDRSPSRFVKAKCKRHINQMALRAEGGPLPTEAADPPLSVISCQYA